MDPSPLPSTAQMEASRTRVIQRLGEHFAQDHLMIEELEARIERALKADTLEALDGELAGLPAMQAPEVLPARREPASLQASRAKTIVAFMGGVVRRGVWTVPSRVRVVALMGGVELDLREARLDPGVTTIRAIALMGAIVVRVPPHVRVESDGLALLGGFEDQLDRPASADPGAPVVRLTGFSLLGGVEAKVERPGSGESSPNTSD